MLDPMPKFDLLPTRTLPMIPSQHPCHECGLCCRYVAIEIDPPRSKRDVSDILWHLYHRDVSAFISHEGDWYLQYTTPCEHLQPGGACAIYQERPAVCREYQVDECERWDPPGERLLMEDALSLVRYLRTYRPRFFDRVRDVVPRYLWADEPEPPRPILAQRPLHRRLNSKKRKRRRS
ncbi:MAG TPA: YkgJ family cysteine cluster protein [Acidobacteriota bacterium]